jgi:2-methylcitrate dehydratase PrpD
LTGLAAVDLAAHGFVGPLDLWDHPNYYRSQEITNGFGEDWTILRTYFKPYACCRWLHAALDAWQTLVEQGLSPSEVERVDVFTFNRAINLNNHPDPTSLEQAQFSLPFCLAVLALEGPQALLPMSADLLGRPQLVAFARKVSLHHDPVLEAGFPDRSGARMAVHTAKGVFSKQVERPRGDPANPLSADELTSKFYRLAGVLGGREKAEAVVKAVLELRNTGVEGLFAALKGLSGE